MSTLAFLCRSMTEASSSSSPPKTTTTTTTNPPQSTSTATTSTPNTNPPQSTTTTNSGATAQRYRYQSEIQAMMYTFGDVRNPVGTTTLLVEDIVHAQIIEILMKATAVAYRRGVRVLGPEDLLFLIRHDIHRTSRLKEFLSWKDVRKNARPTGSAGSSGTSGAGSSSGSGGSSAPHTNATDDLAEINEEDARQLAEQPNATVSATQPASAVPGGGASGAAGGRVQIGGPRRRQLCLYWELDALLTNDILGSQDSFTANNNNNSPTLLSLTQSACQREALRRLRQADLLTQSMSQQEYMEYSECRQASFTYKKARKFREWLTGGTGRPGTLGLATMAGGCARELARLTDDALEILGFLAYELVQRVTEVGLAVKWEMDQMAAAGAAAAADLLDDKRRNRPGMSGLFDASNSSAKAAVASGSSSSSSGGRPARTPLLPVHIEEAYRRLLAVNANTCNSAHLLAAGLNRKRRLLL